MQIPDDERFETYLKRFDPIAPELLPRPKVSFASRHRFRIGVCFAAAAIVLVGILIFRTRGSQVVLSPVPETTQDRSHFEPLTMRSANAWLTASPSFKAAIDDLSFRSQSVVIPKGKQSAVAVLSKEKIKL